MSDISKKKKAEYDKAYAIKNKKRIKKTTAKWYRNSRLKTFNADPQYYLWYVARTRARKFNVPFDIEPEDIVIPEVCPISGNTLVKATGYDPNSMSLDKVINDLGYIKGNVKVVSRAWNLKKSDMSIEQLENIIKYMKDSLSQI